MGRKNKGLNSNNGLNGRVDFVPTEKAKASRICSGRADKRLLERKQRLAKKKGNVKL